MRPGMLHPAFIGRSPACRSVRKPREGDPLLAERAQRRASVRLGTVVMTADTARSIVKIRLAKATAIVSLAAGLATTLTPATAADLYSDEPPPPSYGNAYDDPRYADLYGRPPARVETYRQEDRYYEPQAPLPPARVYREYDRYAERAVARRRTRSAGNSSVTVGVGSIIRRSSTARRRRSTRNGRMGARSACRWIAAPVRFCRSGRSTGRGTASVRATGLMRNTVAGLSERTDLLFGWF